MMNIAAVSSMGQRSQDFDTLQSTLQTGNLSGAQTAFAAFLQDVQKTTLGAGPSSLFAPGTQASKDLVDLGGALKSANLPGAQKAFATLQQDIQIAGQSNTSPVAPSRGHHLFTSAPQGGVASQSVGNILSLKA